MEIRKFRCKLVIFSVCLLVIFLLYRTIDEYYFFHILTPYGFRRHSMPIDCIEERKIFLVETFGNPALSHRQSCAVESAARSNPSMSVVLLMNTPQGINFSDNLMASLSTLPNVYIQQLNVEEFISDSPLGEWYKSGVWKGTTWEMVHISDALRFLLLLKYGGIYIDLDTVTLRKLQNLKNTVILESTIEVSSFFLAFDIGNEFLSEVMFSFAKYYDKTIYPHCPLTITKCLKKYCDIAEITKPCGKRDITILPPDAGFPFYYPNWNAYFDSNKAKDVVLEYNSSYFFHLWNYLSHERKLKIGENSLYEQAMKQRCPLTYSYAEELEFI